MRKRALISAILIISLTLAFALPKTPAGAASTYDFIYNDEVWKLPLSTPIIEKDGFICLPFDRFFKQFGGSFVYDDTIKNFTWFHYSDVYSFNTATGTCSINREPPVKAVAFYENGAYYLPIDFLAKQFGYIFSKLPNGIYRLITLSTVRNTNADYELMYDSMYNEGSTLRTRPDFYLTVQDQPNAETERIIAALDKQKMNATFFMTEAAMKNNPSLVRKIVASGHPYGFTLPETGDPVAYVENANITLQKLTRRKTALTAVENREATLSGEAQSALAAKGYRVWDSNISLPSAGAQTVESDIANFTKMLELGRFNSVVTLRANGISEYLATLRTLSDAGTITLVTASDMREPLNRWSAGR